MFPLPRAKPCALKEILPRRWYPCGQLHGQPDWIYVTEVNDSVVKGYMGYPGSWDSSTKPGVMGIKMLLATMGTSIDDAVRYFERTQEYLLRSNSKADVSGFAEAIAEMNALRTGDHGPERFLDDHMIFDVWVGATDPANDKALWEMVDDRTGGSCSGARETESGRVECEGRMMLTTIAQIEQDPAFVIRSVDSVCPPGAEVYLSPEANRVLQQYPRTNLVQSLSDELGSGPG